jgi:hypothetical protein
MSANIEIRENGLILYYHLSDPLTTDDLNKLIDFGMAHLDQSPHTVYSIVNASDLNRLPINLVRYRDLSVWRHRHIGCVFIIGANPFVRSIGEMLFKLSHFEHVCFCDTEEEAFTVICQMTA